MVLAPISKDSEMFLSLIRKSWTQLDTSGLMKWTKTVCLLLTYYN